MTMALAAFRKARSVELALRGVPYDDIAKEVGYSNRGTAWRTVTKALRERVDVAVEEYRELELARLDSLQEAVWPKAMEGDIKAVDCCLRVMASRSRLLGLESLAGESGAEHPRTVVIQGNSEEFIRGLKRVDDITDA